MEFIFNSLHFSWLASAVFCDSHIASFLYVCIIIFLSDMEPKFSFCNFKDGKELASSVPLLKKKGVSSCGENVFEIMRDVNLGQCIGC